MKETNIIRQTPADHDANDQDEWHADSPTSEKVVNHTTHWDLADKVWPVSGW